MLSRGGEIDRRWLMSKPSGREPRLHMRGEVQAALMTPGAG